MSSEAALADLNNRLEEIQLKPESSDDNEAINGTDSNKSLQKQLFYKKGQKYWSHIAPTVDGMLGGYSNIHKADVSASSAFLQDIFKMKPSPLKKRALDCGAGIGRVTKHLLIRHFEKVDLVEQDAGFTNEIPNYVGSNVRIGTIFNEGLQDFQPENGKYDVIWSQWVLGHLTDHDLEAFLKRCIRGLSKNGLIILKENVTSCDEIIVDEVDSSMTRPLNCLKRILARSGLRIVKMSRQTNFPTELFPVYMIALRSTKKINEK